MKTYIKDTELKYNKYIKPFLKVGEGLDIIRILKYFKIFEKSDNVFIITYTKLNIYRVIFFISVNL